MVRRAWTHETSVIRAELMSGSVAAMVQTPRRGVYFRYGVCVSLWRAGMARGWLPRGAVPVTALRPGGVIEEKRLRAHIAPRGQGQKTTSKSSPAQAATDSASSPLQE